MTSVTKPPINLRAEVARLEAAAARRNQDFDFDNLAVSTVAMPAGWKPVRVFKNGTKLRDDGVSGWSVSFDGFIWSVVLVTALTTSDWLNVECEHAAL